MNICIVLQAKIPVNLYGGTERVVWYLGKELSKLGHSVTFLVEEGSECDFAQVQFINKELPISVQIPKDIEVVHFHSTPGDLSDFRIPYCFTMHGNVNEKIEFDKNTIFVSENHANRYQSQSFVHNGLDWSDYSMPDFTSRRNYFHFLGKAAWRIKNVKGAIDAVTATKSEKIKILGGVRFNVNMGIRFTFTPRAQFYGMVGGKEKNNLLKGSKGLVFPVRWHEPFGLALIESLYFGAPVFGTPYGSLPEIVQKKVGFLSNSRKELTQAIENSEQFDKKYCHEYAVENFNSEKMALEYLKKYEILLSGKTLNDVSPQLKEVQSEKFLPWID